MITIIIIITTIIIITIFIIIIIIIIGNMAGDVGFDPLGFTEMWADVSHRRIILR
jgi:hypothetical protein